MTDCSRTRDAVPLTMASMYKWRRHRGKVSLAVAACAAWRGAEQKKAVQAFSAVHVSTDGQQAEQ